MKKINQVEKQDYSPATPDIIIAREKPLSKSVSGKTNPKIIAASLGLFLTVSSLIAAIFLTKERQELRSAACFVTPTPTPPCTPTPTPTPPHTPTPTPP
ncbi:MAG: hypothetical protein JW991_04435, partial [Candidatus Pacebacteria bacterium]|nr:hypothetical protein [Candidatus Paceibacterota bacterium]